MKHPLKATLTILGWTLLCAVFALAIAPYMQSKAIVPTENPIYIAIAIIVMLGISSVAWYFILKRVKTPKVIEETLGVFNGLVVADLCYRFGWIGVSNRWIDNLLALAVVVLLVMSYYVALIWHMQKKWENVERWLWVSNLYMVVLISSIAAFLGAMVSPLTAIIVLVAASIYDAWAVWKSGTMQKMAINFMKRLVIPGIAVTRKNAKHLKIEKRFGILGGGDLFFLVFVPLSFYKSDILTMYATMAGLFGGLVFLFFFAKKKAFYPALPFMFVGMLVGAALRMLW